MLGVNVAQLQAQIDAQRTDLAALQARVESLEAGHQEHATELASLGVRLGEVQLSLDRLVSKATKQGLTLDRQTKVMERVESLLETFVRQQTPSVVVAGA